MPVISLDSAARFTLEQLAEIFAAGFEGYLVPVVQPLEALAARIRCEQIDLNLSRVILADGAPAGLCLLAQRGRRVRVAAMGVAATRRGSGLGRTLIDAAIAIARAVGAQCLILEVFAANRAALSLYESAGFAVRRRLLGHMRPAFDPVPTPEHQLADLEALAAALAAEPDRPWPWQLSPHTLVSAPGSLEVHALAGDAYACVNAASLASAARRPRAAASSPPLPRLGLRIIYVRPAARRQGLARRLLSAIQVLHPRAEWEIPPIVPEDFSPEALAALGFARAGLHQLEMELPLDA